MGNEPRIEVVTPFTRRDMDSKGLNNLSDRERARRVECLVREALGWEMIDRPGGLVLCLPTQDVGRLAVLAMAKQVSLHDYIAQIIQSHLVNAILESEP